MGHIESVQRVVRLTGRASIKMRDAAVIEHHAIHEREGVAVILRGRKRDGLNLRIHEFLMIRGFLWVDWRGGSDYIHLLGEFLHVIQRDGQLAGAGAKRLAAAIHVEALPLGADGVLAFGAQTRPEIARLVRRNRDRNSFAHRAKIYLGALDSGTVFVNHAADEGYLTSQAGARRQKHTTYPCEMEPTRHWTLLQFSIHRCMANHAERQKGHEPRAERVAFSNRRG